ncbi:E3 ubiquitin-protein ligase RNF180-like isoform X2 [Archocentrus centrarchus]|uniref:E3 ubiquitin-protein ligase RNF180-like isoform X2 n=1 Tax=Archocentrus centrarchus TaxID=63155 RepID=UPI0011EA4A1D|nr:E3 ubiquitin-protein ligase RNF180-like isoform X2 [Archocentrus centrarchus]
MEDPLQRSVLRCRRCQEGVIDSACLTIPAADEASADVCSIWHVNVDTLPEWILTSVHQAQWTAGKLNCQNCGVHLGGFNFINRSECSCGTDTSVHLCKKCLDYDHEHSVLIVQPLRTRLERGQAGLLTHMSQNKEERSDFNRTALESSQNNCAAAIPHMSPAEASHPQTDGKAPIGEGVTWKRALGGSDFHPAVGSVRLETDESTLSPVSYSASQQLHTASFTCHSSVSEGQQLLQTETPALHKVESVRGPLLDEEVGDTEDLTCAMCLDVYLSPRCLTCDHVFCEPCLRKLARNSGASATCPLCRTLITSTHFHKELDQRAKTLFPNLYLARKQNFETSPCKKWPLPEGPIIRTTDDDIPVLHFYLSESNPIAYKVCEMGFILASRCFLVLIFLWLTMCFF